MQLMSVSRTEAEKVFIVVGATDVTAEIVPGTLNSAVGGLHPGQVVEWVYTIGQRVSLARLLVLLTPRLLPVL